MYGTAAKVKHLDFYTRPNKDFCSDLFLWHTFMISWNGLSMLRSGSEKPDFCIQTDASGFWGCAAYFIGRWFQLPQYQSWQDANIMTRKLLPIVLSATIWGPSIFTYKVLYQCDNSSVVAAIKKGTAKDTIIMHLIHSLWFFTSYYHIGQICEHIAGVVNTTADHLSRHNNSSFFALNPGASLASTTLPAPLLEIISIPGPDWISAHFSQLFISTINTV